MAEITIDGGAKEGFLGKPLYDLATDIEFCKKQVMII